MARPWRSPQLRWDSKKAVTRGLSALGDSDYVTAGVVGVPRITLRGLEGKAQAEEAAVVPRGEGETEGGTFGIAAVFEGCFVGSGRIPLHEIG